jgi:secondary thiamine-phosphate synthase enzyme
LTDKIEETLKDSKLNEGLISIFTKHSTSAIVINEDEKGLIKDFKNILKTIVPSSLKYEHDLIDNNASSHLRSLFLSSSETIPFTNGKLNLGVWQSIFFVELDGPRNNRTIIITIIGE